MNVGHGRNPYSADIGVAVYFSWHSQERCIPSEWWDLLPDNLRAIEKTINAL